MSEPPKPPPRKRHVSRKEGGTSKNAPTRTREALPTRSDVPSASAPTSHMPSLQEPTRRTDRPSSARPRDQERRVEAPQSSTGTIRKEPAQRPRRKVKTESVEFHLLTPDMEELLETRRRNISKFKGLFSSKPQSGSDVSTSSSFAYEGGSSHQQSSSTGSQGQQVVSGIPRAPVESEPRTSFSESDYLKANPPFLFLKQKPKAPEIDSSGLAQTETTDESKQDPRPTESQNIPSNSRVSVASPEAATREEQTSLPAAEISSLNPETILNPQYSKPCDDITTSDISESGYATVDTPSPLVPRDRSPQRTSTSSQGVSEKSAMPIETTVQSPHSESDSASLSSSFVYVSSQTTTEEERSLLQTQRESELVMSPEYSNVVDDLTRNVDVPSRDKEGATVLPTVPPMRTLDRPRHDSSADLSEPGDDSWTLPKERSKKISTLDVRPGDHHKLQTLDVRSPIKTVSSSEETSTSSSFGHLSSQSQFTSDTSSPHEEMTQVPENLSDDQLIKHSESSQKDGRRTPPVKPPRTQKMQTLDPRPSIPPLTIPSSDSDVASSSSSFLLQSQFRQNPEESSQTDPEHYEPVYDVPGTSRSSSSCDSSSVHKGSIPRHPRNEPTEEASVYQGSSQGDYSTDSLEDNMERTKLFSSVSEAASTRARPDEGPAANPVRGMVETSTRKLLDIYLQQPGCSALVPVVGGVKVNPLYEEDSITGRRTTSIENPEAVHRSPDIPMVLGTKLNPLYEESEESTTEKDEESSVSEDSIVPIIRDIRKSLRNIQRMYGIEVHDDSDTYGEYAPAVQIPVLESIEESSEPGSSESSSVSTNPRNTAVSLASDPDREETQRTTGDAGIEIQEQEESAPGGHGISGHSPEEENSSITPSTLGAGQEIVQHSDDGLFVNPFYSEAED